MTDHFDDIGAYLLGALSPDEAAAFERAMEDDARLREEVEYLRVAADALPASPIQMAVPADLKGRIMAVVNSEAELLRAAGPEADRPPSPVKPRRRVVAVLRPGWWSLRPGLAVAASMLVLAVGVVGGIVASGGDGQQDRVLDAEHGNAQDDPARPAGTRRSRRRHRGRPGPTTSTRCGCSAGRRSPSRPTRCSARASDGTASVDVPGDMTGVDKVLVTEEPAGGSEEPTTAPVIEFHPT